MRTFLVNTMGISIGTVKSEELEKQVMPYANQLPANSAGYIELT